MSEHIIMCCGARVKICGHDIEVLDEPRVICCPLMKKLYGVDEITRDVVKKVIEYKIKHLGITTPCRVFDSSLIVPYGASEIIKIGLKEKLFDCAVTVCDGAGTVITYNPDLVQAIGARLTGIVKTSPVKETIEYIARHSGVVLDEKTATIDQVKGVEIAIERGFKSIAVTVAGFNARDISKIREKFRTSVNVTIFSICNTCVAEEDIKHILKSDLVWASASKLIREHVGKKSLMQLGVGIPVFVLTTRGKKVILKYLEHFAEPIVIFRSTLPYVVESRGPKLR